MASVILGADSFVCSSRRVAGLDGAVLGKDFFEGFLTTDLAPVFFGGTGLAVAFFFAGRFFLAAEVLTDFLAVFFKDFFTVFFLLAPVGFVD